MSGPVLVDGHNLVHAILSRRKGPSSATEFTQASHQLARLLALWSQLRGREVVLVWDRGADRSRVDGLTQLHVDGPAEADDALVQEAARRTALGQAPAVATRDAELLSRLPAAAERFGIDRLIRDLEALEADPIELAHLAGAAGPLERLPVQPGFPRRRALFQDRDQLTEQHPTFSTAAKTSTTNERTEDARARQQARALQKEQRRARWQRAQSRRKG